MYLYNKNIHMKKEEWKPVVGYEGLYEVSSYGNVKSLTRFTGGRTVQGRPLKLELTKDKYYNIKLRNNTKKQKRHCVHRLVAEAFIKRPYNKSQVNHKDLNKINNNVSNLEWVTPKENTQHSIVNGVGDFKGRRNGMAKLIDKNIYEIKKKYSTGNFFQRELAEEYGVSQNLISKIILGQNWKHLK